MYRRHLLLFPMFAALLLARPSVAAESAKPAVVAKDQPIRALLICGGCCHDYTKQKDILTQGIAARARVEFTVLQDGKDKAHKHSVYANPDWAKGYDVVVHNECFGGVDDDAFVDGIAKAHAAGGVPAVNLHCSAHSYRAAKTIEWSKMIGIRSTRHGAKLPIKIEFAKTDHPITQGMADWTTGNEELYNNATVYPTATPLAIGKQEKEQDAAVVWTNEYHGTRVFTTTLGHYNETVADPRYLDLITRGLLWTLDKLDEQHFTPVKTDADAKAK